MQSMFVLIIGSISLKQINLTYQAMQTAIKETVGNGISHLKAIGDEITKMNIKNIDDYKLLDVEGQAHFQKLQFLQHIINDIIHPMHPLSLKLFKTDKALFLDLIRRNESARASKLLPACFCSTCKLEDENKPAGDENVEQIQTPVDSQL